MNNIFSGYKIKHYVYNLLLLIASPIILLLFIYKTIFVHSKYLSSIKNRFGFGYQYLNKSIWCHAASLGEVNALIPLIDKMLEQGENIVVTTLTPAGEETLRKKYASTKVIHYYAPYDLNYIINKFVNNINPTKLIIMETEIWPSMLDVCSDNNIEISLINARISDNSFNSYLKNKWFFSNYFNRITNICAQSDIDLKRLQQLSQNHPKLITSGNMKYDCKLPIFDKNVIANILEINNKTVIVAASIHPGEDEIILNAYKQIIKKNIDIESLNKELVLILVPRNKEDFSKTEKTIMDKGFHCQRKSALIDKNNEIKIEPLNTSINTNVNSKDLVILGDTMNELSLYYQLSDIVFVGGSLIPIGGHNLLEPAICEKPIITGGYVFNFSEMSDKMIGSNALVIINNEDELVNEISKMLVDESYKLTLANNAANFVKEHTGAVDKIIKFLDFL